jgi:hypothetical protein
VVVDALQNKEAEGSEDIDRHKSHGEQLYIEE